VIELRVAKHDIGKVIGKAISETLKSRNSTESSEYRVWALFIAFGILQEFVQGDSDLPQSGKSYQ
jgi:hypothetical protein